MNSIVSDTMYEYIHFHKDLVKLVSMKFHSKIVEIEPIKTYKEIALNTHLNSSKKESMCILATSEESYLKFSRL